MVQRPIYCFSKERIKPRRVFDVVIEDDVVELQIKIDKTIIKMPWKEVVTQVDAALAAHK